MQAMIAANSAVAELISGAFPTAALLRRHPAPLPDSFAEVRLTTSYTLQSAPSSRFLPGIRASECWLIRQAAVGG